jgi:hypothetical protein
MAQKGFEASLEVAGQVYGRADELEWDESHDDLNSSGFDGGRWENHETGKARANARINSYTVFSNTEFAALQTAKDAGNSVLLRFTDSNGIGRSANMRITRMTHSVPDNGLLRTSIELVSDGTVSAVTGGPS